MFKKLFYRRGRSSSLVCSTRRSGMGRPTVGQQPAGSRNHWARSPHELGDFADSVGLNPNGKGNPIPPGQEINVAKDTVPGVSTPVAVGEFVNGVYAVTRVTTNFGPTPPGLAVKTFTPGCTSGHGATDQAVNGGGAICH
jgi:hypothetical protein